MTQWKHLVGVLLVLLLLCIAASAIDPEVYVVVADSNGYSNYLKSLGNGKFDPQIYIGGEPVGYFSYGNGIGDFDNDGDFDYVIGTGYYSSDSKNIYLYEQTEKTESGLNFAPPRQVGTWSEGDYPMDMPVADFKEDGNADFVMVHGTNSKNSELYLGDGNGGFTHQVLSDTGPGCSFGADAADVNKDGHADFVVAPYGSNPMIYVNLGKGDGTFNPSLSFDTYDGYTYGGLTAADFDNNGNVDLIATRYGFYDFYKGNGDGTFTFDKSVSDEKIISSAIDNYDFNGDGNQDFVISPLNDYPFAVAVYLGTGTGTFTYFAQYDGGSGSDRVAISAPPYLRNTLPNKPPVAVITPATQSIIAGSTASFDGSDSDPDGTITDFAWIFGDGTDGTGPTVSHAYNSAGSYTVTLTVTDDDGQTATASAEVVVTAIPATVDIEPKTLNLKSQGQTISATIALPAGYDASQINLNSVTLRPGNIPIRLALNNPKYGFVANIEAGTAGTRLLRVKFDRQAVIDAVVQPSDPTVLWLSGKVNVNGVAAEFSGSASIRTIMPGNSNSNTAKTKK